MKPRFASVLTIIVLAGAALVFAAEQAVAAGPFADPNLETAVRAMLFDKKDPATPLTDEDLRKVFILEAKAKGIKDLSGLDKCTNLQLINLAGNEIVDVTPLKALANLQSLDLSKNKIADAAPLAALAGMQYLDLSGNQLAALPPLDAMSKLSALYLAENKLTDLAPLAKLTRLSSLDLAKNQIANLAPLAEIKRLSLLKLSDNPLENLAGIGAFTQLSMLFLERNKITDLQPLVDAAKADAEGEKRFTPYLRLYLADNPLSDKAKNEQLAALKGYGIRLQ